MSILEAVAAERIRSAIGKEWTAEQKASYFASHSQRETFQAASDSAGKHAGQAGTILLSRWRGKGVGRQ